MTLQPLHDAEMPLSAHPHWREASWWWAWSSDDRLVSHRRIEHRHGALSHTVDALASPEGIRVDHRSSAPIGHDEGLAMAHAGAEAEPTSARRRRTEEGVLTRDLLLSASPVTTSGRLLLGGQATDVEGWAGVALDASGIDAPDLGPGPCQRPLDALPQRFEVMVLVAGPDGAHLGLLEQDEAGHPIVGALHRAGGEPPVRLDDAFVEWEPGTRQARRVHLTGDGVDLVLRPLCTLPGSLVGGLGAAWPLGGWVGDAARRHARASPGVRPRGLAGVQHEHLCAVDGVPGATRALLSLTALGPHGPSGLTGWTDPA